MSRDAGLAELNKAQGFSFGPTIIREANGPDSRFPGLLRWSSTSRTNNADGLGHAVGPGGTLDEMVAFQETAVKHLRRRSSLRPRESPWIKNRQVISGVEGAALENLHDNHVHVAR